jgi:hypothetical protein
MDKFNIWIMKHRVKTALIIFVFILLVLAGIFIPIESEVTGGCNDGPVVRHDLILGGSIERQNDDNKIYDINEGVINSKEGGLCQKHLLYVL